MKSKIKVIKKDGSLEDYTKEKVINAVTKSAMRVCVNFSEKDHKRIDSEVIWLIKDKYKETFLDGEEIQVPVKELHNLVETALRSINIEVAESYRSFRDYKTESQKMLNNVLSELDSISLDGDKSNANADDRLATTKAFLDSSALAKQRYLYYFLTSKEKKANDEGYIYIHDLNKRLYTMNCCVFDTEKVFNGGFTMGNITYTEPKSLSAAFNLLGDVILSGSSQQYGGFTIPEIEKFLLKYAELSFSNYYEEYMQIVGETISQSVHTVQSTPVDVPMIFDFMNTFDNEKCENELSNDEKAKKYAYKKVAKDFKQGFQGLECMLNSCANAKGDYSFVSITFGLGKSPLEMLCNETLLKVRMEGQGKEGHKQFVLFPKLIFLYDNNLHCEGGELEEIFDLSIKCSSKCMYPDYTPVDVNSNKEVENIYKKYGMPLSQMGCRSAVGPFYESGSFTKQNENDRPVMVGRFNLGVVSLNLILILAKARKISKETGKDEKKVFYSELDYYLEMIRQIHIKTFMHLKDFKASFHPLAFMEGGLWHGTLKANETIGPCLKAATYSFGVTGLNELEQLYHNKSIYEDNSFSTEVMQYIDKTVKGFKKADNKAYSIYGTPAESLSSKQIVQFRKLYGIIPNVSDREYVSNSFHCHVGEEITQIQKQDHEIEMWPYFEGGRIQYVKYDSDYNISAMTKLTRRALSLGLYNGINLSKSFCNDCGNEMINSGDTCSKCGSHNLTTIERVCGYLGYYKKNENETRMNDGKIVEIKDRKSM